MRELFILALILLILSVAGGCGENCGRDSKPYFDIRGMWMENVYRQDTSQLISSSNILPVTDTLTPVPYYLYGIQLVAEVYYYSTAFAEPSSGFGTAYACSPLEPGSLGSQEWISQLTITSSTDFDAAHPAGTSLNEFFTVSGVTHFYSDEGLFNSAIPLSDYLQSNPKARRSLQFWLTQRPETNLEHKFTVSYRLTNGEHYLVTAPKVTFH